MYMYVCTCTNVCTCTIVRLNERCTSRHKRGRDQYGRGNKRVELHQDPKPTKQERKDQRQQDDKEPRGGVSKQSEQKKTICINMIT